MCNLPAVSAPAEKLQTIAIPGPLRSFARMAALAGAAGGLAAALAGAGLHIFGRGQSVAAIVPVSWTDLIAVLPCPLVAAAIAAVTARLTARAVLMNAP